MPFFLSWPEEYTQKKAKLVNSKQDLRERLNQLEGASGGWLEPAKNFISSCNQAGSVSRCGTPRAKREFLQKIGSNLKLKDGSLLISHTSTYDVVAKTNAAKFWRPQPDSNRCPHRERVMS